MRCCYYHYYNNMYYDITLVAARIPSSNLRSHVFYVYIIITHTYVITLFKPVASNVGGVYVHYYVS